MNKQNRDKLIDRELADSSGEGWDGGGGIEQKRKKTHSWS